MCKQSEEQIIDVAINENGSDASTVFGHFPFIRAPRPPTEQEAAINRCPNYVWLDLAFGSLGGGKESVHVNVEHIAKGTLFPFGGHLCTHWGYLAAAASEPASVSTWVRVEDVVYSNVVYSGG